MPQEPKKRHSRARQGKRRASISLRVIDTRHKLTHFSAMLAQQRVEKQAKSTKVRPASTPDTDEE
ncbi:MAG: hypothetical protein HYV40_06655 [Candidatus Levybacteria bacterium]|nr:hypothetical protein [Candidatus Levybacteria bacterium]